ncbi:carbohydrate ABC transporter permease [Propionibacteriaceae bacterium G1746]
MNRPSVAQNVLQYLALAAYMIFLGLPLLWLASTSFKSAPELVALTPTLLPINPTLDNFRVALGVGQLPRALVNSFTVALSTAILTTLIAVPASYALSRYRTKLRNGAVAWILVSQLFPFILLVIPLFILLRAVGLYNSLPGLVVVYITWSLPFTLWMLMGYVSSIPRELEEAAAADGASRFTTLRSIIWPLLAPGVVATGMFAFISAWNEFFFALVMIQSPELQTAPLLLARYVGAEGQVRVGPLSAMAVLTTVPSLALFAVAQRKLVAGLLAGSVKG